MDKIKELHAIWKNNKTFSTRDELFRAIWEKYHPKLQVYIKHSFNNMESYLDASSEILLKVFESIHNYNSKYSFSTWIYRLARNYQIDKIRKKTIVTEQIDCEIISDNITPESILLKGTEKDMVKAAILKLKESDREIVYLYFYENLKYKDISRITGKPLGTIKYRMSECKRLLSIHLQRSFIYD